MVDTGSSFSYKDRDCGYAQVAQLVEHSTENAGVGCSIQPLGTTTASLQVYKTKTAKAWPSHLISMVENPGLEAFS